MKKKKENNSFALGDEVVFKMDFDAIVIKYKKGDITELHAWHFQLGDEEGREIWDVVEPVKK